MLRGEPGARRVEVTASGRIVRDLDTREDIPGKSIKLTIDGPLQDYAARRHRPAIGRGGRDRLPRPAAFSRMASMPSFDPNSFSDGIGRLEWKMLNEDDHVPLLNKALRGLYPPGSTVKPMASLALQIQGVSPDEIVNCPGGYQLGSRFFTLRTRWPRPDRHAQRASSTAATPISGPWRIASDTMRSRRWRGRWAWGRNSTSRAPASATARARLRLEDASISARSGPRRDTLNAAIGQGYVLGLARCSLR